MDGITKISFLVPTLGNRAIEMKRLLDSLQNQEDIRFQIIIVLQSNYDEIESLCSKYKNNMEIKVIKTELKGLSRARNLGLHYCSGEIIVLSDDDCWYPVYSVNKLISCFEKLKCDVLLTQIHDFENNVLYKKYTDEQCIIDSAFSLLSRSSIEIAYRKDKVGERFDELFGLGAKYVCCEEVDFLLRLYKSKMIIKYVPIVTVYHLKKEKILNPQKVYAKGALYAKNFNIIIGLLICLRDFLYKRENNFKQFLKGYYEYKSNKGIC